ncbi:MAG TPA: hypothetical protein VIT41_02620 [Microlunatus sp.]
MTDLQAPTRSGRRPTTTPAGANLGFLHLLCFIGALVYFWTRADTAGEHFLAIFQALVWPAYLAFGALQALFG